jgi:hypothetical protein
MTQISRGMVMALVACLAVAAAHAKDRVRYVVVEQATEVDAKAVVLPSGPSSTLLMAPCAGCATKPFPASATTAYYVGRKLVTLDALKATVAANPNIILTVSYTVKTGALTSVTADLDTAPRARR